MKTQFTPTKLARTFNLLRVFCLPFLALTTFMGSMTVCAQEKGIITLIPIDARTEGADCTPFTIAGKDRKPLCTIVLKFQTDSLPKGATFSAAHLLLVGDAKVSQTISVYANNDPTLDFADLTTASNQSYPPDKRADWSASPDFVQRKMAGIISKPFSLVLQTTGRGVPSVWKGDISESNVSGSRPRLIIEYTVPGPPVRQTDGIPAVHSRRPFMPSPAADQFGSLVVNGLSSYTPVSYKGVLYVINQNQLQALSALGGPPLWSVPLTNQGQHLLISESGRIYIVGNGRILAYQLDPNPAIPATEVKTSGGQPLSPKLVRDLNPVLAPAAGADGSLYFVNNQSVHGLNPDLQELWNVGLGDPKTSRITVSPSGQFVYLLGRGEGLIAINSQTGEKLTIDSSGSQTSLADSKNITFHDPVVIQHLDGTEKIYVAADSAGGGVLANFNNYSRTVPKPTGVTTISAGWGRLSGLWSQPIADQLSSVIKDRQNNDQTNTAKKLYVLGKDQGLIALDWLQGTTQTFSVATLPDFFSNGGDSASDFFNSGSNGGNLVLDKEGTLLVWNGNIDSLYAFTPRPDAANPVNVSGSVVQLKLDSSNGISKHARLLFGSDGTLYAVAPTDNPTRTLQAVLPQFTLGANPNVSSPTHLRVDGTADKATTLTAPGSVFLGSGGKEFKVKSGATLSVKQPQP